MKVYVAGPMQGYPDFNFPAFARATAWLRQQGHFVFSPAERDLERDKERGVDTVTNATGDIKEAAAKGFSLRDALTDDTHFICQTANAIAMLPGWENSKGAQAEWALARALGHKIMYLTEEDYGA
jgi:hypothetical protein